MPYLSYSAMAATVGYLLEYYTAFLNDDPLPDSHNTITNYNHNSVYETRFVHLVHP